MSLKFDKFSGATIYRGAVGMGVAVILGALAAHALSEHLSEKEIRTFETGVRYQVYGCLGLIAMGILSGMSEIRLNTPVLLMRIGIILFSGSLYFLSLRHLAGLDSWGFVGAITPFGGLSMIIAWLLTGYSFYKVSRSA